MGDESQRGTGGTSVATAIPPPSDESALVLRLQAGDEAAFESLVHQHSSHMLEVARRYFRCDSDAEDAVQDAFLSAFKAIGRFEGDSRLSTWLHRITINACLMKIRAAMRRPAESVDDLLPTFDETGHHVHTPVPWRPADQAAAVEMRKVVRECIERLPEPYRVVILLRDIEGVNTAEAAAMLQMTEPALKTRLHRARQALRTLLDPYMTGEPSAPGQ